MQIRMLVSISRSDGFSALQGQVIDLAQDIARDFCANGLAEMVDGQNVLESTIEPQDKPSELARGEARKRKVE